MRLISSTIALHAVVALGAVEDLSLAAVAAALDVPSSAAQRGLAVLLDDRVVERAGERPTYRLASSAVADQVLGLALLVVPLEVTARVAGRANPALEFLALDEAALIVVFSSRQPAALVGRGAAFVERLARHHGRALRCLDHRDVRRELLVRPELRDEMLRVQVMHGDVDRSFPDRAAHGTTSGRPLGRLHPSLRPPSRRLLGRLASRHGIRSLKLFGSAVRSDFRSDSDVDVVVGFRPDATPSLRSLVQLGDQLEEAFDRDVDLAREESLGADLRRRVEAEAVALL